MVESIYLIGSEQVQNAANTMRSATEGMQSAASSMSYALEQHQRFLDNWLSRLESVMSNSVPQGPSLNEVIREMISRPIEGEVSNRPASYVIPDSDGNPIHPVVIHVFWEGRWQEATEEIMTKVQERYKGRG